VIVNFAGVCHSSTATRGREKIVLDVVVLAIGCISFILLSGYALLCNRL